MAFQTSASSMAYFCAAALFLAPRAAPAAAFAPYRLIDPSMADQTVVLTGRDLTPEPVVQVARYGAKVALTAQARQRSADAHALLLEAAAEGVSVYWFNRGSDSAREKFIFTGDPLSAQNKKYLEARQLAIFRRGALAGLGPANMDTAIAQRMLRFTKPFFTLIAPTDEAPGEPGRFHVTQRSEIAAVARRASR